MMTPRRRERLLGLTALATLLFTPPLLLMADRIENGIWLPVYLFVVWGIVIGLAAWLLEGHAED
ncbi:MAG: hypothetical protein ACTH3D_09780 [Halomonas sp.]|uniref:hypothetical protein n=1 Tax=Halomonas sp. TaxID=1486246 RepID=UPI003F9084EF